MDPIDRQEAIDEFNGVKFDVEYCTEYGEGYNDGINFAISRLSELPSAQSEIIRCKDCKHNSLNRKSGNTYCNLGIGLYQLDDYCSYGERRKVDGD